MSIRDWFKVEASWREKATALSAKVAETVAAREGLEQDAATRALAVGLDDKEIVRIEREIQELAARERWLHRALVEAEVRAAADDAAAEAERQRQAAEAKRRRIAELRARHDANTSKIAPAARVLVQAANEYAKSAADLAQEIGGDEARRLFGPLALRFRLSTTQWREVHQWLPYDVGISPEAKRDLAELEREIVAGLLGEGNQPGVPANDREPEAA
jgi:hypothetical protein